MDTSRRDAARERFFLGPVHHPKVRATLSGKNEERVIEILQGMEYILDKDFVRQHPIGMRYVLDFAFVPEQVAIEIDGENHLGRKEKRLDKIRDKYLSANNWVTIRIQDNDFFGQKGSFYKSLIKAYVDERREQYTTGVLYPIDFSRFYETDHE